MLNPNTVQLNIKEREILNYIIAFKRLNDGIAPTVREIRNNTSIKALSNVNYYLDRLQEKKFIKRPFNKTRSIQVIGGHWVYNK